MQPMCTTADNTDNVPQPDGPSRASCEAAGHVYNDGLSPLIGAAFCPIHSWSAGAEGTLASVLLGGEEERAMVRRVPVRVQALFVWQLAAIVERGIGWLTGDYTAGAFAMKRFWTPFSRPFRGRFGPFFGVLVPVSGILGARRRKWRNNGKKRGKNGREMA